MYTRYAVYHTWTHSKTGATHRDRVAYNLDLDEAERIAAGRPDCVIVAYQDAPFVVVQ